jgi:hypothetical protein
MLDAIMATFLLKQNSLFCNYREPFCPKDNHDNCDYCNIAILYQIKGKMKRRREE